MDKTKLDFSDITHTSNLFHKAFRFLKGVFNICQGQTESMYYFCKSFDCDRSTFKLMGWDETSFTGLYKHANDIKDYRQRMADMCFVKTSDPQWFSYLWNYLENGTII